MTPEKFTSGQTVHLGTETCYLSRDEMQTQIQSLKRKVQDLDKALELRENKERDLKNKIDTLYRDFRAVCTFRDSLIEEIERMRSAEIDRKRFGLA